MVETTEDFSVSIDEAPPIVITSSGGQPGPPGPPGPPGGVPASTSVTGGGLATGGGTLATNQVITVPKASTAEAITGTNDDKALTPLGGAAAVEDYKYDTISLGAPYSNKERFQREIPLEDTALVFNSSGTDNAPLLTQYIEDAAWDGKTITAMGGAGSAAEKTLWVGMVNAQPAGHVSWKFTPGFTIKGIGGSSFPGTVVYITNPDHLNPTAPRYNVSIEDLTIDNSLGLAVVAEASATALSIKGFNHVFTKRYTARATTDWRDLKGDSGISQNGCNSSTHIDLIAIGQADLGVYITGDPPTPAHASGNPAAHAGDPYYRNRVGHTLINPFMYRCSSAIAFKRLTQFAAVYGGVIRECSVGVLGGFVGGGADGTTDEGESPAILGSPQIIVHGLRGKRLVSRLVHVGPLMTANVQSCYLQDWGYTPQDNPGTVPEPPATATPDGSTIAAYELRGASNGIWIGNRAEMVEWQGTADAAQHRGFLLTPDNYEGVTYESSGNLIDGNAIIGCTVGIREEGGAQNNHGDNRLQVTFPYQKASTATGTSSFFGQRASDGTVRMNYQHQADTRADNASFTLSVTASPRVRLTATITGNWTLTLPVPTPATVARGKRHRIERTGGGAFNWNIGPGLGNLTQNEWMDAVFNGTAWEVSAAGSMVPP